MHRNVIALTLVTAAGCAIASRAGATPLPFATGFESSQGYTAGTQLGSYADWTGDGQDTSGWQVTNQTVSGAGASSGTQWVLAASPSFITPQRFQWAVAPVTDFTTNSTIVGSADVQLVAPASGTLNRTTIAGIGMYDANIDLICAMYLMIDVQNTRGLGANRMIINFVWGDDSQEFYDLGVTNTLGQYYNLELSANFQTGVVRGSVNGQLLSPIGTTGGATNFHDFDMSVELTTANTSGARARAGFDNFSIAHVPTPGAAAMAALGGSTLLRRRNRR